MNNQDDNINTPNDVSDNANNCEVGNTSVCSVGGQALMEGIMMLGPHGMCQVVRNPKGKLVIDEKETTMLTRKYKILGLPFIRGSVSLFDSMRRGMKALFDSAEIAVEEDEDDKPDDRSKFDIWIENKLGDKAMGVFMGFSMVIAVVMCIGLFFFLPLLASSLFVKEGTSDVVKNLIEGGVRMVIFVIYMGSIALMKDIRRVYMYHGAEHKTIHCFEKGMPLTVENVRTCSKHHPRCGTAFMFVVIAISILVTSIVPRFGEAEIANVVLRFLGNFSIRIILLPFIAGISYEFNRLVSKHEGIISRILRAPGMGLQRLTTKEPDDSMIEVAIVALGHALRYEGINVDISHYEHDVLTDDENAQTATEAEPTEDDVTA